MQGKLYIIFVRTRAPAIPRGSIVLLDPPRPQSELASNGGTRTARTLKGKQGHDLSPASWWNYDRRGERAWNGSFTLAIVWSGGLGTFPAG